MLTMCYQEERWGHNELRGMDGWTDGDIGKWWTEQTETFDGPSLSG